MKCFVSSFLCLISIFSAILKRHVIVVYLAFGCFWVSIVVAQPSIIESPATIPRYEMTELRNGNLQIRESGFEKSIFVFRPIGNNWVESAKLGKDSGTELNGGVTISLKSNISETAENGEECTEDRDDCLTQFSMTMCTLITCFSLLFAAQRKVDILFDVKLCVKRCFLWLIIFKLYNRIILLSIFSAS